MSILLQTNKESINNFTIFAERHCGTNYLQKWIVKCFDISLTWKFGWKHFWTYHNKIIADSKNTLFIGIVRDPYDWIYAMYKKPYHISLPDDITFLEFLDHKIISKGNEGKILEEYNNIISLRNLKNQHLLYNMPVLCDNYLLINYENLFDIKNIFNSIKDTFNIKINSFYSNNYIINKYDINISELNLINNGLNWNIENLLNYYSKNIL